MRISIGVIGALLLSNCGAAEPGPKTVNGVVLPVGDGEQLVHWKNVPVALVTWPLASTDVQNTIGQVGISYELTDEARQRGAGIALRLEGADQEHFEGEWETAAGGQIFGQLRCRPKRAGALEATLVAVAEGREYRARVRCDAVSDYAMFLQQEPACLSGDKVSIKSGQRYDPTTGALETAPQTCRNRFASADGRVRYEVDNGQAYRVTLGAGREPILSPAEQAMMRNFGVVLVSPDGNTVVFGDMSGLYVKRDGPLTVLDAWGGTRMGSRNALAFSADSTKLVVRGTLFGESAYLQANFRVVDLVTGENTRLIPTALSAALPAHGNRFATNGDLTKFLWGLAQNGELQLHLVDTVAGTQVRVFDDAMTHVTTLPGRAAKVTPITLASELTATPDGRYAAMALNAYTGSDYYAGKKGAYVRDLVEGKTWSVGLLPDGSWLSGDGWGYEARLELTDDGQNVLWAVSWSTGGTGGSYFTVNVLVPRRMWQPL